MTAQPSTAASPRIAEDAIRDPETMNQRFCDACNAGDIDQMVSLYEPDAVIVEPTGELTRGTNAIREHIAKLVAMKPTMRMVATKIVVSEDLALNSSRWECDAATPDGSAVRMEAHACEVSRRQPDGTWRILIDNPWGPVSGGQRQSSRT